MRKWNIVSDQSNVNCDIENEIICTAEVSKCNLCNFKDGYTLGTWYNCFRM